MPLAPSPLQVDYPWTLRPRSQIQLKMTLGYGLATLGPAPHNDSIYISAKKKSDKSFNPGRGAQLKKWEKAVREAEDCQGMTRQERIDQFFVSYAHKVDPPSTTPKSSKTSNSKSASSNSKALLAETSAVKTSKTSKSSSKV